MATLYRPAVLATVAAVALLAIPGTAQEKPRATDPPKKPTVMQRKLAHAQKVLEGLALEDFDKIRTSSDGLIECVKDASWRINETDKYLLFSNEFLRTVENLRKAAKDKKVDAAALAYVDMTLTCVKCHRYLRDEGIARAPNLSPLAPTRAATK
jgi:hypothetical protein